jgi:hypothetical protein
MKIEGFVWILLLAVVLSAECVLAVSISPPTYAYDFKPNQEIISDFRVEKAERIEVSLGFGDRPYLSEYASLSDPSPNGSSRNLSVVVRLPEKLKEAGSSRIYVIAKELRANNSPITSLGSVKATITIKVPYPGDYFKLGLEAQSVEQGETAKLRLKAQNIGYVDVGSAYAIFSVYETETDILVKALSTEKIAIPVATSVELNAEFPTNDIEPGEYDVVAVFYYDNKTMNAEDSLEIGAPEVVVDSYTTRIEAGKINRFDITLKNHGKTPVRNLYASLTIGRIIANSSRVFLNPSELKILSLNVDASGLSEGVHEGMLTLYYEGSAIAKKIIIRVGTPEGETRVTAPLRISSFEINPYGTVLEAKNIYPGDIVVNSLLVGGVELGFAAREILQGESVEYSSPAKSCSGGSYSYEVVVNFTDASSDMDYVWKLSEPLSGKCSAKEEKNESQVEKPKTECSGCLKEGKCLPYGIRDVMGDNQAEVYCDISGGFIPQKADGLLCLNSFECRSNYCSSRKCVNLEQQLKENRDFLAQIYEWLRSLFRLGNKN